MNDTQIKDFFSLADTKIKLTKQVKQLYSKELAPNFNLFNFWWLDENTISKILAFFLDPRETHGQGDIYLKHFLTKFGLDFFGYNADDKVIVQCEYRIENDRRIDIVISKNSFEKAIAIENKIYDNTQDQNSQIKDYHDFLNQKTKDEFCLFYLRPGDKTIPKHSIKPNLRDKFIKKGTLKLISYENDMVECIKEFEKLTENDRVRSFLKDFEKTLKKMYMGEKD